MLAGAEGDGVALAMRIVAALAERMGAAHLLDISSAHIDSCLYHGQAGVDFVRRLVAGGAMTTVPATLNVSSLDLLHPQLYRGDPETAALAKELMDGYVALGCSPTWTCAPYQAVNRPGFGEHVAWAESNATVFVNTVLGARSNRYGDFIDIACAITGRAPAAGLHLDSGRIPQIHIEVESSVAEHAIEDWFYPVFGYWLGAAVGSDVSIVTGLPPNISEDRLKALGASAATSGSVALIHIVGSTPEAPDHDASAIPRLVLTRADLEATKKRLSRVFEGPVGAVSLGAPHYSIRELTTLLQALEGRRVARPVYVNTSRDQVMGARHVIEQLEELGVKIVTDTCTYISPIIDPSIRSVMTDSAKWAHYAPGNLGVTVVFGSWQECVEAAVAR